MTSRKHKLEERHNHCKTALNLADEKKFDEAIAYLSEHVPAFFKRHRRQITSEITIRAKPQPIANRWTSQYAGFRITDVMSTWVQHELSKKDRALCLFLDGVGGLGKTEWARSLGRHIYYSGSIDTLANWDDDAMYIVLDNIPWNKLKQPKSWLTCKGECTLAARYGKKRSVIIDKPCIYITNGSDMDMDLVYTDSYWLANAVVALLTQPLF